MGFSLFKDNVLKTMSPPIPHGRYDEGLKSLFKMWKGIRTCNAHSVNFVMTLKDNGISSSSGASIQFTGYLLPAS